MKANIIPTIIKHGSAEEFICEVQNLTSHIAEGIIIADSDEKIMWVNNALENISGYPLEKLIGKKPDIFQGPETDKKILRQIRRDLDKNETVNAELINYRPDGSPYWIKLTVSPVYDRSSRLTNYIAFEHDITENKIKEQNLINSEKQFKDLFMKNPCVMWIFDPLTLKFEEVNEAAINTYGYSREEFLNMSVLDIRLREDGELLKAEVQKPFDSYLHRGVWRHIKKDGEAIFMEVATNKIEFNGKICLLLLANDVTDKQKKEMEINKLNSDLSQLNATLEKNLFIKNVLNEELKEREARLRISNEAGKIAYWERNLNDNTLFWSEKMYELFGFEPGITEMTFELFVEKIHPADRKEFLEKLNNVLKNRTRLEVEYRVCHSCGKTAHIYSKGDLVLNENGVPEKIAGISMDITKRKEAEIAAASYIKKINTILQSLTDPFYVINNEGVIILANEAAAKLIGLTPEEATGKNTWSLFGDNDSSLVKKEAERAILEKITVTFDYEFNGMWYEIFMYPSEIGLAISAKNIDEKKKAKRELEQQVKNINIILKSITDPFYIIDKDYNLLFANETIEKELHKSADELIGRNIFSIRNGCSFAGLKENFDKSFREKRSLDFEAQDKGRSFRVYLYPSEIGLTVSIKDITIRKKQEEELKNNAKFLNEIGDSILGFVFQTEYDESYNMKLNYAGKNAFKYWGIPVGELMKDSSRFMEPVHYEDRDQITKNRLNSVKNLENMNFKLRYVNVATKETRWMRIFAVPTRLENGHTLVNGTAIDITDTENYYNRLEEANRKYEYISKATNNLIWEYDIEKNECVFDGAYENIFKCKPVSNPVSGDFHSLAIHPEDRPRVMKAKREIIKDINKRYWEESYRIIDFSGVTRYLHDRAYIVYDEKNTKPVKVIGTTQDVTELKKAEEDKQKIIDDLVRRNQALEKFTYIVSHNLRAPVANIMGIADYLNDEDSDKQMMDEMHELMKKSVHSLDIIIKDINAILSAGRNLNEEKSEINLTGLVEEVKHENRQSILNEKAQIICDFSAKKTIYSVKSIMYSIFSNLISNSIKFRNSCSPVIKIESGEDDKWIYLSFEDNGRGIDLEKYGDKIFGLYKKFHAEKEGKGMGLFMVKTQVENLNGYITVQSEIDRGTKFVIKLKK